MNKILYTSGEFYLLPDWPDDDSFKFWKDDIKKEIEQMKFNKSIEQSKSNKIKIANPELLPDALDRENIEWVWKKCAKDGDTFDFPEGLRVKKQFQQAASTSENPSWINTTFEEAIKHLGFPTRTVAILSKEDNSAHSHTEGSEEPKDSAPVDKPNFERIATTYARTNYSGTLDDSYEKVAYYTGVGILKEFHREYCLPLQQRVKELEASIRAGERLRMMDAASAINEANDLREKVKQLEEKLKL